MNNISLIPFKGEPFGEVRKAYFLKSFGLEVENMDIVSFGSCNFSCPYCKRDGQYLNADGSIYTSQNFDFDEVLNTILLSKNRIRLSGGDPCNHIGQSMKIAEAVYCKTGKKISIAHNGSSPYFIKKIHQYLEYAAIDIKASTGDEFAMRAGLPSKVIGEKMLANSLKVQNFLTSRGIYVDIRTCVFGDTTLDDLLNIAKLITTNNDPNYTFWTVRGYNTVFGIDWKQPHPQQLMQNLEIVSSEYPNLKMGYRNKWTNSKFVYFN